MTSSRRLLGNAVAGVCWGATLLSVGDRLWTVVAGASPADTDRSAIRLLGARYLLVGVGEALVGRRAAPLIAGVEGLHAVSMVGLAALEPARRRPAVVSALFSILRVLDLLHTSRRRR